MPKARTAIAAIEKANSLVLGTVHIPSNDMQATVDNARLSNNRKLSCKDCSRKVNEAPGG
jgi:hypothetical protein